MFKIKPGWIVVSLSVLLLFGCLPKNEEGKETWNPLNWGSTLEMPDGDSKNLGSELFTLDYEPKTGIRANGEDELTLRATIPRDASDGFYTITFKRKSTGGAQ